VLEAFRDVDILLAPATPFAATPWREADALRVAAYLEREGIVHSPSAKEDG
jgi:hypothetical protein